MKQTLSYFVALAEIYYNTSNFSYQGVCAENQQVIQDIRSIQNLVVNCFDTDTSYVVMSELPSGGAFCVDSAGARIELPSLSLAGGQCMSTN